MFVIVEKIKTYLFMRQLKKASEKALPALADAMQPPLKDAPIYMEFVEEEDDDLESEFIIRDLKCQSTP